MNDVQTVVKFVSDNGLAIILAGIVVYVVIRVVNILLKRFENLFGSRTHDKLIDIRNDINLKVQSLINQFLFDHDGDRVQVIEFSNSVMSVAYLPFKYMTCTYEVYRIGKSPGATKIDRISTSLFTKFFASLYSNDFLLVNSQNPNENIEQSIYDLLDEPEDPISLCLILKTSKGKSLGCISFKKSKGIDQNDIDDGLVLAEKVSALLGITDK